MHRCSQGSLPRSINDIKAIGYRQLQTLRPLFETTLVVYRITTFRQGWVFSIYFSSSQSLANHTASLGKSPESLVISW